MRSISNWKTETFEDAHLQIEQSYYADSSTVRKVTMRRLSSLMLGISIFLNTLLFVTPSAFAQSQANPQPTFSQGSVIIAQANNPKYDIKVVTTTDFEDKHIANDEKQALQKARERTDGGQLLHYMKRQDISSLPEALKRKFATELSKPVFVRPVPDILANNYWIDGKFPVWEYDRKKDKITIKKVYLCLGLINFRVSENIRQVEIGLHHIHQVRD